MIINERLGKFRVYLKNAQTAKEDSLNYLSLTISLQLSIVLRYFWKQYFSAKTFILSASRVCL